MSRSNAKHYFVANEFNKAWGITVDTLGCTDIPAQYGEYPPKGHPDNFNFNVAQGRIINSYQLIYISRGKGRFYKSPAEATEIKQGDMILLKPGVWHSYRPAAQTGWQEYWIGFNGDIMKMRFSKEMLNKDIFRIGIRDDIVDMFINAINIAEREQPMYQNVLACTAEMILALTLYYDKNSTSDINSQSRSIRQAQAIIRENITSDISPEDIARQVNMSYSWFRKSFKSYTGISPIHYILSLRIKKAKELLAETDMSIKEITYRLRFSSTAYFTTVFRRLAHTTPSDYRQRYDMRRTTKKEEQPDLPTQ